MNLGIAIASGTFKGVFGHGVLSAFEKCKISADVYATCSSSVLSGGLAAVQRAREVGVNYWLEALERSENLGMSDVVLQSIDQYGPMIKQGLFADAVPRFLIATSQVLTSEAQEATQGLGARRLGRKLIIDAMKKQDQWARKHLATVLFDSALKADFATLSATNFNDVAYASTRMLHAWEKPAWINGQAFVDGSYTCACPAQALAQLGCKKVVVIASEPGEVHQDIFQRMLLTHEALAPSEVCFVKPEFNLAQMGVDFTKASVDGMKKAYQYGNDLGMIVAEQLIG